MIVYITRRMYDDEFPIVGVHSTLAKAIEEKQKHEGSESITIWSWEVDGEFLRWEE